MNIDDLKFGDIKKLMSMFSASSDSAGNRGLVSQIGKKVIIRTYSAGVFYGELAEKSGSEVILKKARRMYRWKAAESISLSAVSIYGVIESDSKIVEQVDEIWLDAIEVLPCTHTAQLSIEGCASVKAE